MCKKINNNKLKLKIRGKEIDLLIDAKDTFALK
jgi:hypothetical protein